MQVGGGSRLPAVAEAVARATAGGPEPGRTLDSRLYIYIYIYIYINQGYLDMYTYRRDIKRHFATQPGRSLRSKLPA